MHLRTVTISPKAKPYQRVLIKCFQLFAVTVHLSCGLSLRLPDGIFITTASPHNEQQSSQINTDLVAPQASSISLYSQLLNYPQPSFFQQPAHLQTAPNFPFLYTIPAVLIGSRGNLHQPRNLEESTENESQSQERSSYSLYRPSPEDNPEFMDMQPPSEQQSEPNYYAMKPRKNKKYSEADEKEKKYLKKKVAESLKSKIVKDHETEEPKDDEAISTKLTNDSVETIRKERETSSENEDLKEESSDYDSVESAPSSRLDFQMHGKD